MAVMPAMRQPGRPQYFYSVRRLHLIRAAAILAWSNVTIAERLGISGRTLRRWWSGESLADADAVAWLQSVARAVLSVGKFRGAKATQDDAA